jgi:O-antigen ligase
LGGILAAVSAVHTIYADRTIQSLLLLLAYLFVATVAAQGAREVAWAERTLLAAILTSGMLACFAGIISLIQGQGSGLYANLLTGPFGYPNAMAAFLLLTGGAALAIARVGRHSLTRVMAMAAGAIAGGGVILTGSRGALLAALVGCILWVTLERHTWWARRHLWLPAGAVGLVVLLVGAPRSPVGALLNLFGLGTHPMDTSLAWRKHILQWTWAMAREHAWWGVGPGAFPVALTHYQRIPYVSGENPHNLYLELAAEYGVPAALLAVLVLGGFLARVGTAIAGMPTEFPRRRAGAVLLATLVAFFVHSLGDLDWSFPAIAATAATMLGLAASNLRGSKVQGPGSRRVWRWILIVVLAVASLFSLARYSAVSLVTWGRQALSAGDVPVARRDLRWALRLNPWNFPAHQWMAWVSLRSGDPRGAIEVAERAARIAPLDPNSQYLLGEVAASVGRWDIAQDQFQVAVDRAPAAQFRFHAALVESAASRGRMTDAQSRYEEAIRIFSPERVMTEDARCLAPGDRYLQARISRIVARLYAEVDDPARHQVLMERAQWLAQPDRRGICVTRGSPGQTSPEAVMESFWRALAEGGWSRAEQFLAPNVRVLDGGHESSRETAERPRQAQVAWIAGLTGGEFQASLRYELEMEDARGHRVARCAQGDLRLFGNNWFVERLPVLEAGPCWP